MEFFEKEQISLYLSNMELLEEHCSKLQNVQIYEHPALGKVLVIDGEIQNIEKWAPFYHEAITHIPMMFIEQPHSVLILGGGDLYAAHIILTYPSVKRVVICDHDSNVISLTKKYYSHAKEVINDSRVQFIYTDARWYISNCEEKFDLIIDDCFNLIEAFNEKDNVFEVLKHLLTDDVGICCSLLYRHIFDKYVMKETKRRLFERNKTILSLVTVPEYPGILHLLAIWGYSKHLSQNMRESVNTWHKECITKNHSCGMLFSPKHCQFYLYLPPYIRILL